MDTDRERLRAYAARACGRLEPETEGMLRAAHAAAAAEDPRLNWAEIVGDATDLEIDTTGLLHRDVGRLAKSRLIERAPPGAEISVLDRPPGDAKGTQP